MANESCKHYDRHCSFISPCCEKVYPCRLCHDDIEKHEIDRHQVKQVKCNECETVQKVQKSCEKCGIVFGKYFCETCRLYDDKTEKGQFHCDKCGLCRVGGKENFFHCDKCDLCLGISLKDKHKCLEKSSRINCPVCMENLHTSTEPVTVPRCNHLLHTECYSACLKSGNYACPTCGESLVDMKNIWAELDEEVARTPMPDEYKDTYIFSLCRDCHEVTKAFFHVVGQKCQKCGSYNTCGSDAPENNEDAPRSTEGATDNSEVAASGDGQFQNEPDLD